MSETQDRIEQAWRERGVPMPDDWADLAFVAAEAVDAAPTGPAPIDWPARFRETPPSALHIADEVLGERVRQHELHGVQTLDDGTGEDRAQLYAAALQRICDTGDGVTWAAVLLEEVAEAMAEKPGSPNLRTELVQIAAVCIQWVQAIDRRGRGVTS